MTKNSDTHLLNVKACINQGAGQMIIRRSQAAIVIRIVLVGDTILGLNKGL